MENNFYVDAFVKLNDSFGIINQIFDDNVLVAWFGKQQTNEELININNDLQIIPINKDTLQIGDKVELNTVFYPVDTPDNPHQVSGTIIDYDGYWFYVDWENGCENTYRGLDIDLIKK